MEGKLYPKLTKAPMEYKEDLIRVVCKAMKREEGKLASMSRRQRDEYDTLRERSFNLMYTLIKRARETLGIKDPPNMLDVGCGEGLARRGLIANFGNKYMGVDVQPEFYSMEKAICNRAVEELSGNPWYGRADLLFCSRVMEYSLDPIQTIDALSALMSDSGLIAHISDCGEDVDQDLPCNVDCMEWLRMYGRYDLVPICIQYCQGIGLELHMIFCRAGALP